MSNSTPPPLLPTTVLTVLQYIKPPALLTSLPPHLISPSLAQRHRFLHLTPDNPAEYLSWPTNSLTNPQQTATDLLESLQEPLESHIHGVRYTGDAESTFAHVAISTKDPPGLRVVFQWDSSGIWKFHNLTLMPFPSNSCDSVQGAIEYEFLSESSISTDQDEERDSYWDAYGLSSDDANDQPRPSKLNTESDAEDVYWAQYSAVHGSADSTLATPHTKNQNLVDQIERVIVSYPSQRTLFAYDPLAPPSPRNLAHLLANISPRPLSPLFTEGSDTAFDSGSGSDHSGSSKSSPNFDSSEIPPSTDHPSLLLLADTHTSISSIDTTVSPTGESTDESRSALKDTIRSIYRLWKAGRPANSFSPNEDGKEFLDVVRQVITESSF